MPPSLTPHAGRNMGHPLQSHSHATAGIWSLTTSPLVPSTAAANSPCSPQDLCTALSSGQTPGGLGSHPSLSLGGSLDSRPSHHSFYSTPSGFLALQMRRLSCFPPGLFFPLLHSELHEDRAWSFLPAVPNSWGDLTNFLFLGGCGLGESCPNCLCPQHLCTPLYSPLAV